MNEYDTDLFLNHAIPHPFPNLDSAKANETMAELGTAPFEENENINNIALAVLLAIQNGQLEKTAYELFEDPEKRSFTEIVVVSEKRTGFETVTEALVLNQFTRINVFNFNEDQYSDENFHVFQRTTDMATETSSNGY